MADRLLKLSEAAALIGFPENTLRWWRAQNTGPRSARVGGRVVYRETELLAWVDAQFESSAIA